MLKSFKVLFCALLLVAGLATPALADSFTFNVSNGAIIPPVSAGGSYGTVELSQLNETTVVIDVTMTSGYALFGFAWNMVGTAAALNVVAAPSSPWGGPYNNFLSGGQRDGFGDFEYSLVAPTAAQATTALSLMITRTAGGALSMAELESFSNGSAGNGNAFFVAEVTPYGGCAAGVTNCTGFAGAGVIPEPASMILFGTGLFAAASVRRFRRKK